MTPAIKVEKLTKTYPGGVEAVQAIDFEVAPGEVFGLHERREFDGRAEPRRHRRVRGHHDVSMRVFQHAAVE